MSAASSLSRRDGGVEAITAVGVAQVGAALLTGGINKVTTSTGQTAVVLQANVSGGVDVTTLTATAALLFPPVGGSINGLAINASVAVAANKNAACQAHPNGLDYSVSVGA